MMRTVLTSEKFVGDVVSRLVQYYDRVKVKRHKKNRFVLRIVATRPRSGAGSDNFGSRNPVVFTGFSYPPFHGAKLKDLNAC